MAGIIKAERLTHTRGAAGRVFHFADITDRANEYLAQVRRDAEQVVEQARRDAESIRRQASEEGRQAAERAAIQAGLEVLEQRLNSLVPALKKAVEGIEQARNDWLHHWEKNAVKLAISIAARVIRRELRNDSAVTADLIREALELASGQGRIKLRLHPDDEQTLGEHAQWLSDSLIGLGNAEILADDAVERGGCVVETEFGVIDQQPTAQLKRIEEELLS